MTTTLDIPNRVDGRKLAQAYVAITLARKLSKTYVEPNNEPGLQSLVKVLNVTTELMDELLREAFPEEAQESFLIEAQEIVM